MTAVGPSAATVQVTPKTAITLRHEESGGTTGPLGAATAAESCSGLNWVTRCTRTFQNGASSWRYEEPARIVYGDIYSFWNAQGGFSSSMGWPTADPPRGRSAYRAAEETAFTRTRALLGR